MNSKSKDATSFNNGRSDNKVISLLHLFLILFKNLKLLLVLPSIVAIISILYALFFTSPSYLSKSTFITSSSSDKNTELLGLASNFGVSMPFQNSIANWSYIDIVNSKSIKKKLLTDNFTLFEGGNPEKLFNILNPAISNDVSGIKYQEILYNTIETLSNMIEIDKIGGLFELKVSASSPILASAINFKILEALEKHQQNYNEIRTSTTRIFIEERLIEAKQDLASSEEKLTKFRANNRLILESPELHLKQERMSRDITVKLGVFTALKQQLETLKIEELKDSDYVIILDEPSMPIYPYSPDKKLIVIINTLLGIFFVLIIIFLKEYYRALSIEDKAELRKIIPYLGKNIVN